MLELNIVVPKRRAILIGAKVDIGRIADRSSANRKVEGNVVEWLQV